MFGPAMRYSFFGADQGTHSVRDSILIGLIHLVVHDESISGLRPGADEC